MFSKDKKGFATMAIHSGHDPDEWSYGPVAPPLVMSTIFKKQSAKNDGYYYGRCGNPCRNSLQVSLATLENGKYAYVFPSGMGAITALTSLTINGHLISSNDLYSGTRLLFKQYLPEQNIEVSFVDACKTENILSAIKPKTKMVWIETPTNPILKLADIKDIVERVKAIRPDIYIVIDNTFATCYFQKPLELGVDVSMYSLTKYMNGHTDVIMGAAITRRNDIAIKLKAAQEAYGLICSPFDCTMVLRSLKTLEIRMRQHMDNGLAVAKFLESHPLVTKVNHPLLPSHPQHELAKRQMTGHSGMVAFYHKVDSEKFLKSLQIFTLAASLGGTESIAQSPYTMNYAHFSEEERIELDVDDKLIRLSIGLESVEDIIADLDQALNSSIL